MISGAAGPSSSDRRVDPTQAMRAPIGVIQQGGGLFQLVSIRQEAQDHSFVRP